MASLSTLSNEYVHSILSLVTADGDVMQCYQSIIKCKDSEGNYCKDMNGKDVPDHDYGYSTVNIDISTGEFTIDINYQNLPSKINSGYCGAEYTAGQSPNDHHVPVDFSQNAGNTMGEGTMSETDAADPAKVDFEHNGYSEFHLEDGSKVYCKEYVPCPGSTSFTAKVHSKNPLSVLAKKTSHLRQV